MKNKPFCAPVIRNITYISRGVSVPATLVLPLQESPCPVVVMAHGHGGNREEHFGFGAIAAALAERGVGSIRMDFPGCGESTEPFTMNCLSHFKADVLAAARYAQTELLAPSIGLFGYSMGGRTVLELLAEGTRPGACVLLAPANDTRDLARTVIVGFDALHEAALREGSVKRNETEILSPEWFRDMLRYEDPAAEAARVYHGPSLVIWAQDDMAVRAHVSAHAAQILGAQTLDASGSGHAYGFVPKTDPLRDRIANAAAAFFAGHLLRE